MNCLSPIPYTNSNMQTPSPIRNQTRFQTPDTHASFSDNRFISPKKLNFEEQYHDERCNSQDEDSDDEFYNRYVVDDISCDTSFEEGDRSNLCSPSAYRYEPQNQCMGNEYPNAPILDFEFKKPKAPVHDLDNSKIELISNEKNNCNKIKKPTIKKINRRKIADKVVALKTHMCSPCYYPTPACFYPKHVISRNQHNSKNKITEICPECRGKYRLKKIHNLRSRPKSTKKLIK